MSSFVSSWIAAEHAYSSACCMLWNIDHQANCSPQRLQITSCVEHMLHFFGDIKAFPPTTCPSAFSVYCKGCDPQGNRVDTFPSSHPTRQSSNLCNGVSHLYSGYLSYTVFLFYIWCSLLSSVFRLLKHVADVCRERFSHVVNCIFCFCTKCTIWRFSKVVKVMFA